MPKMSGVDLTVALPLLRSDVGMTTRDGELILTRGDTEYCFGTPWVPGLRRVAASLDGRHSGTELPASVGLPLELLATFLEKLLDHDLAVDLRGWRERDVDPSVFYSLCRRLFPAWRRRLFGHPLWRRLATGGATREEVTAWLLENYHFIDGASDRIALAAAECPDRKLRAIFAKHHAEEFDHGHFFIRSLNALGVDPASVAVSRPLPGTRAVLDHMRHAARQDPVQYAVCSGFLESTGADHDVAVHFLEELSKHYGSFAPGWVEPMVEHLRLDADYGHGDKLAATCEVLEALPLDRASAAIGAGALLVEALELWSTDILACSQSAPAVPRPSFGPYRSASPREARAGGSVPPANVSSALQAGSAEEFLEAYWVLCDAWAAEIFARPFWNTLLSGQASPVLVLGWGVEFYHYVEAANEHMAMATAHCRDDSELRQWLAAHYVEEYAHSSAFLEGLVKSGLVPEQVTAAPPLASTRALVNYLNELAISDVLGYTGVFGVMQSPRTGRTRENVDRLYGHLAALYGFARPFLESVRRHAAADLDLGHARLVLERLVARNGAPTDDGRARIVRAARDVTERFVMFFDGIEEYYASADAELPRRPSDVRGLL